MKKDSFEIKITLFLLIFLLLLIMLQACSSVDFFENNYKSKTTTLSKSTEISLVTYNIKAIYEKSKSEIDNLLNFINRNGFDIVVFQELFDESTRETIIEKADTNNFSTIISRVDYNSFPEFIFQDSGLFMMGRFPRVDLSSIDFGDYINNSNGIIHMILEKEMSQTNDFLANKSVLGVLFNINDSTSLFLFTAHVQAAGTTEHKEFQLSQIKNFIEASVKKVIHSGIINSSNNLIVTLAGDFNSNAYSEDRSARLLYLLGSPRDLHKEFHGLREEYTFRGTRRYDYIFAYDSIAENIFRKVKVKSITVEDVTNHNGEGISDHKALLAELLIN